MARRITYASLALTTIVVGLLVHLRASALGATAQDVAGDVLYAMMMAWWMGAVAPVLRLALRSAAAFAVCSAIELSQLSHAPLADALRATRFGQLVLGSGIDTRDLAAYALGVASAALLEVIVRERIGRT